MYAFPLAQPREVKPITSFKTHPVRFLSMSDGGTLCYSYDGEIYSKQLPYIALGMLNFFLLCGLSVFVFGVPHKGSFLTLTLAALLYIIIATGMGLLISTFMKSQIAAIFGTAIITLIPATQFSGMIDPVASLEGPGRWIGEVYPTSHFLTIARGTFSKALDLTDLWQLFIPLLIAIPLVMGLSILLLKKQEG